MATRTRIYLIALTILVFSVGLVPSVDPMVEHESMFRLSGDGKILLFDVQTGEKLSIVYRDTEGIYNQEALEAVNRTLRCHGDKEVFPISLKLIELIDHLEDHFAADEVRVVSGYRSPEYNEQLRRKIGRVAHDSLHMQGLAMDIMFQNVSKSELGKFARLLNSGGVGVYRSSNYVHIDVGPVRSW